MSWASATRAPIPVLLYHRIADRQEDRFAVAPSLFAEHVRVILASGRMPLTLGEVADGLRGMRPLPARPVAITFDDGFDDTLAAVGYLNDRNLPSTVYVTAGSIDQPGRLANMQLSALAGMDPMVALGAHSVSHPRLDELSGTAVQAEVSDSKRVLEDLVGRRLDTFAYPYGAYDTRVRAAVIEAGFRSAAAVKNAISHPRDDPWAVARFTVTGSTRPAQLALVLDGRGAPPAWQHERLQTRASRVVRRTRRRLRRHAAPCA